MDAEDPVAGFLECSLHRRSAGSSNQRRTGRASAREAVQSCLDRLDAVNPHLNAVVQQMAGEALAAADAADAKRARGNVPAPLHGVPMTVKVNVGQVGHATTNGVVAFAGAVAREDAPVVANLRAAGGIIIGRTNVPAFSMRAFSDNALHGRTLNPLEPTVSPGGSSGGAGAGASVQSEPAGGPAVWVADDVGPGGAHEDRARLSPCAGGDGKRRCAQHALGGRAA